MQTKHSFNYWQWRVIISTMIGYSIFYFVRKNFSFAIPALTAEYGITKASFGIIMTLVGLIYGLSKLLNGMLADRMNARWHMTLGLLGCVVLNFIFGWGASISTMITGTTDGASFVNTMVVLFAVLLVMNNIFQGAGFPPCNRLITHWVPPKELATKMSIWNVSHSLGGSLVAILCGSIIATMGVNMSGNAEVVNRIANNLFSKPANSLAAEELEVVTQYASHVGSWQMVFWIPALIGVIGVIFIFLSVRDTPKSVGLEELKGTETVLDKDDSKEAYRAFVKKMVWKNPLIWTLAIADFFVYIIRGIVFDWGPTFLTEAHFLDPQQAGYAISAFEVAGIFGILTSGWISDKLFGGKAQRVCAIYMGATAVFAGLFFLLPSGSGSTIITILVGGIGFFLYGPQALLGVVAANHATKKAASTALGVIGFTSYLSTIVSGAMIGFFLQKNIFNWSNVFLFMFAIALVGTIIMASLWKLKGDGYQNSKE